MTKDQKTDSPWYIATLGGMASYLEGATMVSLSMAIILLQKELGLSAWSVGALSASLTLSFSTGAIVGGRLGDLFGRRVIYSADLVIYAVGALTVILSPDQAVLFAGVIVTVSRWCRHTGLAGPGGRGGARRTAGAAVALLADAADDGRRGLPGHLQLRCEHGWLGRPAAVRPSSGGLGHRVGHAPGVAESSAWLKSRHAERTTGRRKLREAFRKPHGTALLATSLFFVIGGIMPNTLTQFGPYLIVNLGHSTMQVFSTIGTVTFVVGLVIALLLQRFADTKSRTVCLGLGLVALVAGPLVAILGHFSLAALTALFILNTIAGAGRATACTASSPRRSSPPRSAARPGLHLRHGPLLHGRLQPPDPRARGLLADPAHGAPHRPGSGRRGHRPAVAAPDPAPRPQRAGQAPLAQPLQHTER